MKVIREITLLSGTCVVYKSTILLLQGKYATTMLFNITILVSPIIFKIHDVTSCDSIHMPLYLTRKKQKN